MGRRLYIAAWIVSTALMLGGVAWFSFLSPTTKALWLGGLMEMPFFLMLLSRYEKKGFGDDGVPDYGNDSGPWTGP